MKINTTTVLIIALIFLVPGLLLGYISMNTTEYYKPLFILLAIPLTFSGDVALGLLVWTIDTK